MGDNGGMEETLKSSVENSRECSLGEMAFAHSNLESKSQGCQNPNPHVKASSNYHRSQIKHKIASGEDYLFSFVCPLMNRQNSFFFQMPKIKRMKKCQFHVLLTRLPMLT